MGFVPTFGPDRLYSRASITFVRWTAGVPQAEYRARIFLNQTDRSYSSV
jgi:hypothetical protein